MSTSQPQLFPEIINTIRNLRPEKITAERKLILQSLINFIQDKVARQQEIRLNFICTHNSRRSHLSQVWGQVMAYNFELKNLFCYSGGTEATALFPKVAETLQKSGLFIQNLSNQENPVYGIKYTANQHPIIGFSKKYDDAFNPTSNFAAIMTCSQADAGCPFIPGAEKRIPITFEDPKAFDNSPEQDAKYMERNLQIATEMYYIFSKTNQ